MHEPSLIDYTFYQATLYQKDIIKKINEIVN